ncbi:MAG: methyltransferase domain-containing protein [Bryobacteraceae bacterium]|jgi:SAM-dependent methyltransferase
MPGELESDAAAVARHYDDHAQAEAARLEQYSPVEYAITLRYLARFVSQGAAVAEAGVGVGHYSEFLARRGCRLDLLDVSASLLRAAHERLDRAGLAPQIAGVHHASATALPLADGGLDAILLLGPLYHLREPRERERAVEEAARVLKPGGVVLAAGINRIAFLRDMFRSPDAFSQAFFGDGLANAGRAFGRELSRGGFIAEYLATGNLDPQHAPPIGYAHLTTAAEFRELLAARFEELALVGVESFTAPWQDLFPSKPPEEAAAWLDLVEATGATPEGLACSDHFLFVGRKRA